MEQPEEGGEQRHADEHAHQPEEVAAHHDGEQHPQRGDADGLAQDLGADEVAVQLLDEEDEHREDQRLDGVHQQQDEDAGDGADEGDRTPG